MLHLWNTLNRECSGCERGSAVKTVIVGGGTRCLEILELMDAGHVRELDMEVARVATPGCDAPGISSSPPSGGSRR